VDWSNEDMTTAGAAGPIKVALVNDYEVVVRGLAHMLARFEDIEVVELDSNVEPAEPVDVALFDTFAQDQGEGAEVRALLDNPNVRHVVVYSWNLDRALQRRTIDAGVGGYVSKALAADELAESLRAVAKGATVQTSADEAEIPGVDGPSEGDWPGRSHGLTARESEVLALITQGLSNQQIAERTHLSINSVKTYIRHAYHKIGATSRSRAVLWGIDNGFRPDHVRVSR
jgi:DNA-binding NarL/FixJ family response regulator